MPRSTELKSSGTTTTAGKKSGRPPGRPKGSTNKLTTRNHVFVQRMFQQFEHEALETMVTIMRDLNAEHAVRLKAANDILNRARGTPVSTQIVEKTIRDETGGGISMEALSSAATADLLQLAAALSRYVSDDANVIDVTPTMPYEVDPLAPPVD